MDASLISKIQMSKEYAQDPKRVTFHTLALEFRGDNSTYTVALGPDGWSCSCPGFHSYGICPHIMTLEKIFQPMLKRTPLAYAPGQNIVSDVKKAKRYSEELDRIKIISFQVAFKGDNKDHTVSYDNGKWDSTSSYFKTRGICAYTMAMERILGNLVEPIRQPVVEAE
jgi:hypothetical protein